MTLPPPCPDPPLVILVEDDPAVCKALGFALEMEGFGVEVCLSSESLMSLVLPVRSACLVIDERLPDRSGFESLVELRRRGVQLPAALITSNPQPPLRAAAARAGVPIIEKPLIGDALMDWIKAAVAG